MRGVACLRFPNGEARRATRRTELAAESAKTEKAPVVAETDSVWRCLV